MQKGVGQKITGRLIYKSLVKTGRNDFGEWRIINFVIQKTHTINRKKYKFKALFVAKSKWATFVDTIPYGEKITIRYVIDSKEYAPNKWGTDLRAIEIEKHVSVKTPHVYFEDKLVNKDKFEMNQDLQLNFNDKNKKDA